MLLTIWTNVFCHSLKTVIVIVDADDCGNWHNRSQNNIISNTHCNTLVEETYREYTKGITIITIPLNTHAFPRGHLSHNSKFISFTMVTLGHDC